ncbi:hypothetical protein BsWGS_05974 [Bradybaena similaris]
MCKRNYLELCILVILSVVTATPASNKNITFDCPAGWDMIGTHCYNFVNISMDFEDAKDVCDKYGAKLLVIRDEVEAANVSSLALMRFAPSDHFWIYNGRYEQDSGTGSLSSTFCKGMWQPNEPRDTDEDVGVASNMQGRWTLAWVWSNLPFVCRTPACPKGSFRCKDGACLNMKWKCDGAFDCKDLSDESDCSDSVKYYKNSSGTVDTSNIPSVDFYQWIIEGQPGEVLRVEFETLPIEDNVNTVRVYSGGPSIMTSELVQDFSPSKKLPLFSKNHFVIVTLQSYTKNSKPVKFNWQPDNEASWKQVNFTSVTDTDNLISSPYYKSSMAPVSYKREWLLTAPEGELITLEVIDNSLELNASSDFYIVTNVGFALKELNSNKAVYISSKNIMSLIIKTRSLKKLFNFKASFRKGCDFSTNLTLATFTLKNLPANLSCSWIIQNEVATNFSLQINETSIEKSDDTLKIYDGRNSMVDTLNVNTIGIKDYESVSGGFSFTYVSDVFHPSIELSGKISAGCKDVLNSTMNLTYSNTTTGELYSAQVSCPTGFRFKQEEYSNNTQLNAICREGGIWYWGSTNYTRTPECQIVYCGFPPPIPHGFVSSISGNITYNSVASYQCFPGFGIIGTSNVTCQADGSWTATPSCIADNCSAIQNLVHGNSSNSSDVSEGSVVTFSCEPGYSLQGPRTIACLANKTWSHHQPECKELTCPLPVIEHGHYEHKSIPKFGESVSLVCDSGYQINRTQSRSDTSITCGVNRTLSVDNDTCVDINECSNSSANNCSNTENCVNLVGSYSCVCKSGFNESDCKDIDECTLGVCHQNCTNLIGSYSCSCYEGYTLYSKNGTNGFYIPAAEDGLKPGDVYQINNTCVPVTCNKEPEHPADGTLLMIKSTYYYNESVNIVCSFGYTLENPSFATCQSDGNWTYNNNSICKKMTCRQPPVGKHEASRVPATFPDDIEPGASLTITCKLNDGSGNVTNKTLFCAPSPDDYGHFSLQGDNPECPEVSCGNPWLIPGGNITHVSDTTYGSSFEFACERNFNVTGESTLGNHTVMCQSNGHWGYANLTCEGSRCKDPGTLGGTVQIVRTSYEMDQIVQYNCTQPGYTPETNDTLVCEYKNGSAEWSGVPPICKDTEPPVITCPTLEPLDLYSTLVYPHPDVTDNSNFTYFTVESGPQNGSVITQNETVKYKVTDRHNEASCEFNVTVKDRTEPTITCPPVIQRDLAGRRNELFNLTEDLLLSHSGDGTISFDRMGPLNLTVGRVVPVRVNITKDNGLVRGCAFLVTAVSATCTNDSLPPLDHGKIENCVGNGNKMDCVGVCDNGYLFQNASNSTSYSCVNGTWDMGTPPQSCTSMFDLIYDFHVTLNYTVSGLKFNLPSPWDDVNCSKSHCSILLQHIENISACGYNTFTAVNCSNHEISSRSERTSFTLQLSTADGNPTSLKNCVEILRNQSEALFGPTNPSTANMSCLSPWFVATATVDFVSENSSCSNNSVKTVYNGMKYCLPCGPGMFFNTTTKNCQPCQDGYYQDEEGQAVCKTCPHGVFKSNAPRTNESHCFELCPAGFISSSGYIEDNCTPCPENNFSISSNSCQPCPNNGSTLGISGATSVAQCSDPCSPGEYSITGHEPCSVCPKNFYSSNHGAKICDECATDTYTDGNGSSLPSACLNGTSLCTEDFCDLNGTMNNSGCEIKYHRPVCQCKPGFYGDSCNKSCNVCNPNPCYNEGTCTASGLNFICTCKIETTFIFTRNQFIPYTTTNTSDEIVLISAGGNDINNTCRELCHNNTDCKAYLVEDDNTGKLCFQYIKFFLDSTQNNHESYEKIYTNQTLFGGQLCENDLKNECDENPCTRIDFCMNLVGGTKCQCPHDGGSYDSKCAKLDDPCQDKNCSTHGKCPPDGSVRAVCECEPGYTGDNCEIDIDECGINNQSCLYNGSCHDGVNNYSCSCVNGFSGRHCEVLPDFCHHNDCRVSERGICTNDFHNFTASCTCGEHYILDSQNPGVCIPITYCSSNPCVNGTCSDVIGGCNCTLGFEGSLCQHNIDDCVNHICRNGATCVDGVNNYTCTCPAGFRGFFCEENIANCSGKCVVNNTEAACEDLVEDYYCPCKPAYTGKNCSEAVNMCTVYEPCLNGGTCSNFSGGYNCTCAAGWTGENCDQEINHCSSHPCQNNGICYNLVDQYYCKCPDGTAGDQCDLEEELCSKFNDSVCSLNGKCQSYGGTIECQCLGEYSGKACELEKDPCADNPCNGGLCTRSNMTYECDCSNVKNGGGKNCNETQNACSACPNSTTCHKFEDQDGHLKSACLCRANEILVGDTCKTVDRDYDLVFLESFADKRTFVTSERGFYLNTSLSISMWVAAAEKLSNDKFILALRSSKTKQPFLSVFNSRVQFTNTSNVKISVELTEDIDIKHFLDKAFTWHFISIVWLTSGSLEITFDNIQLNPTQIAVLPSDEFVFVQLGQSFYGYISQVSIWKTALTSLEQYEIYRDKLAVPQPDSLLLGWTQYSFDSSVRRTNISTAAASFSICNITNTFAHAGPNRPECKSATFTDKTPPQILSFCNESLLLPTDYSKHQVSSSELGYEFIDETEGTLLPESRLFSFGAYDIAVSAEDSAGNIGVCMTRAYITPNQCRDSEPSQSYLAECSNSSEGKRVTCPSGMQPSVPTPNFVSCSNLLTYNLDNLYEKPDRIVCGVRKPLSVTVEMKLSYRIIVKCDDSVITSVNQHLNSTIMTLNNRWIGLCSDTNCSNVNASGLCTSASSLNAHVQISGLNASLSSPGHPAMTPLEIMKMTIARTDIFNYSHIAACLENMTQMDEMSSCDKGYSPSEIYCVQCGQGSFYDEREQKCKLCKLNTYSDVPGNISCAPCPPKMITLQRGSSSFTDCRANCTLGQMLNLTINACVPCPKNFYQDQEGKSYCFPCPPATETETNGAIKQVDCKGSCPEGEEDVNGTCVSCPDDHYKQMPGFGSCLNCTGDFTSTPSNRSYCTEIFCDVGRELKAGNCSDCDYGYYKSARGNDSCIKCPFNTTTASNASVSVQDCSRVDCPAGSYRNESTNSCFLCKRGTYQNLTGKNSCVHCNANFTTASEGSINSSQCYELCPQGNYLNGTNDCVPCPVGQYQNESDQTSCKSCEAVLGYNTSTVSTQMTDESDCLLICSEGFHLNITTRSCVPCSIGTYKSGKNLDTECQQCEINFTTANENETSAAACILDKCKKGYYRDTISTDCKPCPVGEYQDSDTSLNVTACTPCPNGNTTLLEAAPVEDGYCIENCSTGEEYHITLKNCTACPVGMYRPEGAREPPTCLFCSSGYTTLKTGENKCIPNKDSTLPAGKIDLSVVVTLSVQACLNPEAVRTAANTTVFQLILNQNSRYPGLCVNNCTSNLQIEVDKICDQSSRRKRQTSGKATVNVTVKQTDPVLNRTDGLPRSSMAALMEAFYDLDPVKDLLTTYGLSIDSVRGIECGPNCIVSSFHYPQICLPGQFVRVETETCEPCPKGFYSTDPVSKLCESCPDGETTGGNGASDKSSCNEICLPGQFVRVETETCEPCPKGFYSTDPVSKLCESCPDGETTGGNGASDKSSCNGTCASNNSYCEHSGTCTINSEGKSFCNCQSEYFGYACSQRKEPEDSNIKVVIGVTVGVAGLLLILLLIGCLAYRRRQADDKSTNTSVVSESDVAEFRLPRFMPTTNWSDPFLFHGETIDLQDRDTSVYFKQSDLRDKDPSVYFKQGDKSELQNVSNDWD